MIKICEVCGKEFDAKKPTTKTCSTKCVRVLQAAGAEKALEKLVNEIRVCPYCGKEFNPRHNRQKYCSSECQMTANLENRRIKAGTQERYIPTGTIRKCAVCGKEFPARDSRHVACSPECRRTRNREFSREWQKKKSLGAISEPQPKKVKKKNKRETLTAKKIQELHENGMTYAEWQIAQTMATIEPVRTVL